MLRKSLGKSIAKNRIKRPEKTVSLLKRDIH